ncbi:MAG: winged helix-turn-helix domain-containing protein, partial [Actinotalea sp.]|nr:winged helix-turn-helix domain-containing protein [Actinotalea sp.]
MEFLVLGPLVVLDGDRARPVDGHRRRALLAALVSRRGRTVPPAELEDALWPDGPPPSAHHTLHTHVSRLRRELGVPVEARDGGYALDVPAEAVDAGRFGALLAAARRVPEQDPERAVRLLTEALALWRGPAYGGAADLPGVRAEARALEARRLQARERLATALVHAGRPDDAVVVAEALVADEPARETGWAELIRALVAAGRPADGVAAYHRAAAELAELGLLPAAALRAAQAEALAAPDHAQAPGAGAPDAAPGPDGHPDPERTPAVPSTWSPLVGRDADLRALDDLLQDARLVTLLGPGGVGKTRLALEVLRTRQTRHRSGVRWVDLASVHDASAVAASTVSALGVTTDAGPTAAALRRAGALDVLVVLDNCEHVLDAVAEVVEELLAGGRARLLATSRERLGVPAERVHPVRPLGTEGDGAARRLFLDRAAAAGAHVDEGDLATVDAVVQQLDGLPLAIEMAAARTMTTGLRELADALRADAADLRSPHRRGSERHRTLRAVIAWSQRLLDDRQREALQRWPVLAGPVPIQDAVAVLEVEPRDVEDLVARSLLLLHPTP